MIQSAAIPGWGRKFISREDKEREKQFVVHSDVVTKRFDVEHYNRTGELKYIEGEDNAVYGKIPGEKRVPRRGYKF